MGTRIAASSRVFSIQHSGHHWLQPQVVRSRPRLSRHLLISASQIVRLLSDYCQIIKRLTGAGVGTAHRRTTLRAAQPGIPKDEHTVPERVCAVVDHSQASFASSPSQLSRAPPHPGVKLATTNGETITEETLLEQISPNILTQQVLRRDSARLLSFERALSVVSLPSLHLRVP